MRVKIWSMLYPKYTDSRMRQRRTRLWSYTIMCGRVRLQTHTSFRTWERAATSATKAWAKMVALGIKDACDGTTTVRPQ